MTFDSDVEELITIRRSLSTDEYLSVKNCLFTHALTRHRSHPLKVKEEGVPPSQDIRGNKRLGTVWDMDYLVEEYFVLIIRINTRCQGYSPYTERTRSDLVLAWVPVNAYLKLKQLFWRADLACENSEPELGRVSTGRHWPSWGT